MPALPAGSVAEEAVPVAPKLQAMAFKQDDQARALSELTFLVQQLLQTRTTEGQASQALPTESGGQVVPEKALLSLQAGSSTASLYGVTSRKHRATRRTHNRSSYRKRLDQHETSLKTLGWLGAYALVVSPRRCWLREGQASSQTV